MKDGWKRNHPTSLLLSVVSALVLPVAMGQEKLPNIVVIFADDLGYNDVSCYGGDYPTPVLDQMAQEGLRATDCIVPANVCSPSRASLLTGRYPKRNGHPLCGAFGLHPEEITIPEVLKPAGYTSLAVGKWHLGFHMEGSHPLDAGFDEYVGFPHNYLDQKGTEDRNLYRNRSIIKEEVAFEEITPFYNKEVGEFIEREKEGPFFIYMSHQIAHTPILPGTQFKGKTKKGIVADFVSELDHSVGTVLDALEKAGVAQNTLVVFLSDNGQAGMRPITTLSGKKFTTMEGGHRVPCIFRWPGEIKPGVVSDTTITSMDLFPLFCHLAGVKPPTDRIIDGDNIHAILMGQQEESPHEFLYYYNGHNLQAVRKGKWKLHLPRTKKDQPYWGAAGKGTHFFQELAHPFLVNLEADILEEKNVADEYPEMVRELSAVADRVKAELGGVQQKGGDERTAWTGQ